MQDSATELATISTCGNDDPPALARLGMLLRCDPRHCGFACIDRDPYLYGLRSGTARVCAPAANGHRQIVDFLRPGDLFGIGPHGAPDVSLEAIVPDTTIARYPRRDVELLAEADRHVSRWVQQKTFQSISRLHARIHVITRNSARSKVCAFLLNWTRHSREADATSISLPMSRHDIADYLSIAVESVSRALTTLRSEDVIWFQTSRQLVIRDRRALELSAEMDRHAVSMQDIPLSAMTDVNARGQPV